jgi:hypothetical protein
LNGNGAIGGNPILEWVIVPWPVNRIWVFENAFSADRADRAVGGSGQGAPGRRAIAKNLPLSS